MAPQWAKLHESSCSSVQVQHVGSAVGLGRVADMRMVLYLKMFECLCRRSDSCSSVARKVKNLLCKRFIRQSILDDPQIQTWVSSSLASLHKPMDCPETRVGKGCACNICILLLAVHGLRR